MTFTIKASIPASHLWEHLRYINNILTVGMVPALFPDDEKEPLVGAIRARRSRQPPSIHQVFPLWFSHWNWELTIFCGFKIWFYLWWIGISTWWFFLERKSRDFCAQGPGRRCVRDGDVGLCLRRRSVPWRSLNLPLVQRNIYRFCDRKNGSWPAKKGETWGEHEDLDSFILG